MPRFGLHIWVGAGLLKAADEAARKGCDCLQVFARNPRGWRTAAEQPARDQQFRELLVARDLRPLMVHASYLVNLASPDRKLLRLSLKALSEDCLRAQRLGAEAVVVHTGYHRDAGRDFGIARVAQSVDEVLAAAPGPVRLLLENTAGAGSELGGAFEDFPEILSRISNLDRLGLCFDTCHAHVAGYDLSTARGLQKALARLDELVGLDRVQLIHLNDARSPVGSRRDAHTHIGKGTIGLDGFRALVNHPRLRYLPMILETPVEPVGADMRNLRVIRSLAMQNAKGKRKKARGQSKEGNWVTQ